MWRNVSKADLRARLGCDFIVGGSSAIAHAGWTTQIQLLPEVLTRGEAGIALPGLRIRPRAEEVFDILSEWISDDPYGEGMWPVLRPEMAIADAWLDLAQGGGTHIYDPDDLDPDEIDDRSPAELSKALRALPLSEKEESACRDRFSRSLEGLDGPGFR